MVPPPPRVAARRSFLISPFGVCSADFSLSSLPPHGGQGGRDPGSSIKHFTTRKKELVEGTKSQIKGNAKAKVII